MLVESKLNTFLCEQEENSWMFLKMFYSLRDIFRRNLRFVLFWVTLINRGWSDCPLLCVGIIYVHIYMRVFSSFDIMLLHLKLQTCFALLGQYNPDGTFVFLKSSILNILTSILYSTLYNNYAGEFSTKAIT